MSQCKRQISSSLAFRGSVKLVLYYLVFGEHLGGKREGSEYILGGKERAIQAGGCSVQNKGDMETWKIY
jgi:hypothetical protein